MAQNETQCTPWGCQPPWYEQPSNSPHTQRRPIPESLAFCRVWITEGPGQHSGGSGVAISASADGSWTAVLTCKHVVGREGKAVEAIFPDETRLRGQVCAVARECDAAVVKLQGRAPRLIKIYTADLAIGQQVYAGGFDGLGDPWRSWKGQLLKHTLDGDYVISGKARSGDSGGPVWVEQGLVGIIWGTDGQNTYCTSLPRLANFLTSNRYIFPWNAWLADRKDARDHGQTLPPQPMPGAPRPLPGPSEGSPQTQPPAYTIPLQPIVPEDIRQRLATLESRVQTIEKTLAAWEAKNGHAVEKAQEAITAAKAAQEKAQTAVGAAQEAKEHASGLLEIALERAKEYLKGWLPAIFGIPPALTIVLIGVLFWLIRKDIRNRMKTGDPLEAEKVLRIAAAKTPTPIDDKMVEWLSLALDRVIPRPTQVPTQGTPKQE
ncbi:MAG: serine protease [Gloeomargarita sp. SKYB31]|nr:serine protease [Gloeomargarita sp. SKYB31]